MTKGLRLCSLTLAAVAWLANPSAAQDGRTVALAHALTDMLQGAKLDSIATRQPGSDDVYVAALFFPGQLLVVSSKYAVPALMNERIALQKYRDAYIDLNVAVDSGTKVFIEDMGADGIRARRAATAFDIYSKGETRFPFDGDWKKRKLSEDAYMSTFSEAETHYTRMLESLIAELKKRQGS
jgi:hypothetical protein